MDLKNNNRKSKYFTPFIHPMKILITHLTPLDLKKRKKKQKFVRKKKKKKRTFRVETTIKSLKIKLKNNALKTDTRQKF